MGSRRVGPDPEGRVRPRELPDPDFLLFLIMSSSDISMAADMFAGSEIGFRATTKGSDESERKGKLRVSSRKLDL